MKKNNKVAIVTGASRGIGAAIAEALAVDGYSLALVARSKDKLDDLAQGILSKRASRYESKGSNIAADNEVFTYPLDVQDHEAIQAMVKDVQSKFGQIDLLFNNAGISMLGTTDATIEDWDKTLAINLRGAFSFLKGVVPIMKKQRHGYIINLASIAGKVGFAEYGVYCASKFGMVGVSESLFHELAPLGIKVTAICPSWVDTDMAQMSGLEKEEMIDTSDIVSTVRWLLSLSPAAVIKELTIGCRKD